MKLIQKHLFRGTQTFEILDDRVDVRIKVPFKKAETLSVMLVVLNPEPVITQSRLDFVSRVNGEALLSLYLGNPNAKEFNAFVALLKQSALQEYQVFTGIGAGITGSTATNVLEAPPESADCADNSTLRQDVNLKKLENAIQMLETYLKESEIAPLLTALKALQADPQNESNLEHVLNAFNALGSRQGAVLTYAPYVGILLADDPFRNL